MPKDEFPLTEGPEVVSYELLARLEAAKQAEEEQRQRGINKCTQKLLRTIFNPPSVGVDPATVPPHHPPEAETGGAASEVGTVISMPMAGQKKGGANLTSGGALNGGDYRALPPGDEPLGS
jgi:hypothetical protein